MFDRLMEVAKSGKKAQLSLEFLLVYSVVLIVFLIIFALIVSQRASTLSSQDYSAMQLVAQTVVNEIDSALAAGNGYSATVYLPSGIGALSYNISVSSSGVVTASTKVGKSVVSAQTYSEARSLVINGTVTAQGNGITVYSIPAYRGSVYVANSEGTIYVDTQPASTLPLPGSLNAEVKFNGESAGFNGANSYVDAGNSANMQFGSSQPFTISAWVDVNQCTGDNGAIVAHGLDSYIIYTQLQSGVCYLEWAESTVANIGVGPRIPTGTWVHVVAVSNTGSSVTLYIDGVRSGPYSFTYTYSYSEDLRIGSSQSDTNGYIFSGQIANVQIYNTSLSSSQVQQLYNEGIGGTPIDNTGLVGWWPLNGNANDYSGYGNQGTPYNITFYGTAQINAHVSNQNGANSSGDVVGFTTTSGNFGSSRSSFANYTNTYGNSTAYLVSNSSSTSIANITVTAFNGNYTIASNVVGWWPLNEGTGNVTYDLSTHYNNGASANRPGSNGVWSTVSNQTNFITATFPGNPGNTQDNSIENGFITVNETANNTITRNKTFTVVTWIYYKGSTPNHAQGIFGNWPDPGPGFQLIGWGGWILNVNGSTLGWPSGSPQEWPKGRWEMITAEYSGTTGLARVYLNGSIFNSATLPASLSLTQKLPYYIGNDAWQPGGYDTFNGSIENVQLYSTFLTQQQIASLYKGGINSLPLNNAGLVGWWPLNGNANDYSGKSINGTIQYNVTFLNANYNLTSNHPIAYMNGANDFPIVVNIIGKSNILSGTDAISIFAWVKINPLDTGAWQRIASYGTQSCNGQNAGLEINGNGVTGSVAYDSECGPSAWTSNLNVNNNQWHLIGFVMPQGGSSSDVVLYMDGQPYAHYGTNTGTASINSQYIILGGGPGTPSMLGDIADVQIYNTSLSSTQVMQIYQQGLPQYKKMTIELG